VISIENVVHFFLTQYIYYLNPLLRQLIVRLFFLCNLKLSMKIIKTEAHLFKRTASIFLYCSLFLFFFLYRTKANTNYVEFLKTLLFIIAMIIINLFNCI